MHRSLKPKLVTAFPLAAALFLSPSCETISRPLLNSATSVPPALVGKQDYLLIESAFFTVPDDFELLKNTSNNHVAGVFSPSDGENLLKQLKRHRKIEVMSTPSVTARQGQQAKIELIREIIFPVEFAPPVVGEIDATPQSTGSFPVTPTRPTKFDRKDVGLKAEFKGSRTTDRGVTLEFKIDQVNLLGFINYGSPITTTGETALGRQVPVVLTENKIEQPVFAAKSLSSTVTIPNGHYLAVGGLRNETLQSLDSARQRIEKTGATHIEEDKNLFVLIKVSAVKP